MPCLSCDMVKIGEAFVRELDIPVALFGVL